MTAILPPSYLNMWRAVVALVHADHVVRDEEEEFIREQVADIPFTPEERRLLEEDLITAGEIDDILPKITDQEDLKELLRLAMMLFWHDGEFSPEEQALLDKIKAHVQDQLDMEALKEEARKLAEAPGAGTALRAAVGTEGGETPQPSRTRGVVARMKGLVGRLTNK